MREFLHLHHPIGAALRVRDARFDPRTIPAAFRARWAAASRTIT
jgi:hypothetical protein